MNRLVLATCLAACWIAGALAQQAAPAFEDISIKRSPKPATSEDAARNAAALETSAVFDRSHATVADLIRLAYEVRGYQLVGAPRWTQTEWFEVKAKAAAEVPADQMRLMLRSLLADRFGLVIHREQRAMQYVALVMARSDGLPGPYLRPVADDCSLAAIAEAERNGTGYRSRPRSVSSSD